MNNGRNKHERAAISALIKLAREGTTERQRQALANGIVKLVVDAAVTEIRKEMQQDAASYVEISTLKGEIEESASEIIAKQLKKDGGTLPHPPTYEERLK